MWKPYEQIRNRKPDFLVEYSMIPYDEGGRVQRPFQGYRSDLHYEGEDIQKDGIYMIHPEFLNEDGSVMLDSDIMVPWTGRAFMWILFFEKMWDYHRQRDTPGRRCWFMEGSKKVAEATIIEQIGLTHHVDLPVWTPESPKQKG